MRLRSVGILVLACVFADIVAESDSGYATLLKPGAVAPSFSLPTLTGERETLRIWCGEKLSKPYVNKVQHIVVISFWATYCKPCQKEIPELMQLAEKHKGRNLKIFLISIDDKGALDVRPFAKEKNYTLPILLDPFKKTSARYGVKSLPALFVIDGKGVIRYSSVGYKEEVSLVGLLDTVVLAIRQGRDVRVGAALQGPGESVAVRQGSDDGAVTSTVSPTPREKWNAVAQIECGTPPEEISEQLGVSEGVVRQWYEELKRAALQTWAPKADESTELPRFVRPGKRE